MKNSKDWNDNSQLLVHRYWLTGTIALSLIGRIGLIDMSYLILDSTMVFSKFQASPHDSVQLRSEEAN